MKVVALTLGVLLCLSGCGNDDSPDDSAAAAPSSASATPATQDGATDVHGFPEGFAYPPGATVERTAAQHSVYVVPGAKAEAMKDYWDPHLTSMRFEVLDQTAGSTTYQRGTTTIQVTWNQAGGEVRGAANVLTP